MGGSSSKNETIKKEEAKKLFNSIVRIDFEADEKKFIGTGFFIKFSLKNKIRHFLMTCHHIIQGKFVIEKKVITLYYGKNNEEEKFKIKFDRDNRYIKFFDKPVDITLIEILEEDNIKEDIFLEPDLNYKNGNDIYLNDYFYLPGYPQNNLIKVERTVSYGKITRILNDPEFEHSFNTDDRDSGSPICSKKNLLVVGIHKQGDKKEIKNYGTFLGYILGKLENEFDEKEDKYLKNIKLLENIKSKYVIEILFSNLDEKMKLKTIKYNKKLQKKIGIILNNYKFWNGRYIRYETNEKGKEFNPHNGKLIYEGGYVKGERNGKGREYNNNDKLIYEGEYLNDERLNGKVKEYYNNGKL